MSSEELNQIKEPASQPVAVIQPPKEGVARAAAEKNKKPRVTRRRSQEPLAKSAPAPVSANRPNTPLPQVQGLAGWSTEVGILLLFATTVEASLLVRVGLAQTVPEPWILPADETRRVLVSEIVVSREQQQARVYLGFVPLVALSTADMVSGPQLFGAEVEGGGLVTFTQECEAYSKANSRKLSGFVARFQSLYQQVIGSAFAESHPLRQAMDRYVQQAAPREATASVDAPAELPLAAGSRPEQAVSAPEALPDDLRQLERQFLLNPGVASYERALLGRLRTEETPEALAPLAEEVLLLERVIAAGERVRLAYLAQAGGEQ